MLPDVDDLDGRVSTRHEVRRERVRVLLDALHTVVPSPAGSQEWTSRRDACTVLGTTDEELQVLVEAGLAERDGMIDRFDVWNVGLRDQAWGARPAREMVFLNRLLRAGDSDWLAARKYDVTVTARCPHGAACAGTAWTRPDVLGVGWASQAVTESSVTWRGHVVLQGTAGPALSAAAAACWDRVTGDYRFQFTPPAVAGDVNLTRGRRVGDCVALSRLLAEDLQRAGVEARVCSGYMFGGLRMRQHQWVTARERGGMLVTLDPSMALLADDFFGPEFREFCRGSHSNRCLQVGTAQDWFVEHWCGGSRTSLEADVMMKVS